MDFETCLHKVVPIYTYSQCFCSGRFHMYEVLKQKNHNTQYKLRNISTTLRHDVGKCLVDVQSENASIVGLKASLR